MGRKSTGTVQENDGLSVNEMSYIGRMFTSGPGKHAKNRLVMVPHCDDGRLFSAFFDASCLHSEDAVVTFGSATRYAATYKATSTHHIRKDFLHMDIDAGSFSAAFLHFSLDMKPRGLRDYIAKTTLALDEEVGLAVFAMPARYFAGDITRHLAAHYEKYYCYRSSEADSCMIIFIGERSRLGESNPASLAAAIRNAAQVRRRVPRSDGFRVYRTKEIHEICMRPQSFDRQAASVAISGYHDDWAKIQSLCPSAINTKYPLMPLRNGHIAQLLASGVMNGVLVEPGTKERFLVKGAVNRIAEPIEENDAEDAAGRPANKRVKKQRTLYRDIVTITLMHQNGIIENLQ